MGVVDLERIFLDSCIVNYLIQAPKAPSASSRRTRGCTVSVLSGLALVLSLSSSLVAEPSAEPNRLVAHLPDGVEMESAIVQIAYFGKGLCILGPEWTDDGRSFVVKGPSSVCDVSRDLGFGTPRRMQIVAYFPGYRVATFESDWEKLDSPTRWKLTLDRLPVATVQGRVVNKQGQPRSSVDVEITYSLLELMDRFGYADGSVPVLTLVKESIDSEGGFSAEIPRLTVDPFFDPGQSTVEVRVAGVLLQRVSLEKLFAGRLEVVAPTK